MPGPEKPAPEKAGPQKPAPEKAALGRAALGKAALGRTALEKAAPPPLRVDTVRVVLIGTALWAVALVVLLLLGDRVDRLWTWTCVAGIVLAGIGLGIMRWQGQLGRRAAGDRDQSVRTSKSAVS